MKEKEVWLRAALSAFQGIISGSLAGRSEVEVRATAALSFDAADAFVEEWQKRVEKKYYGLPDIAE